MKTRTRLILVVFSLAIFLFICFSSLLIILLFFTGRKDFASDEKVRSVVKRYKYHHYDPKKNKSTVGYISQPVDMPISDFEFYGNDDDTVVLISNFESREFKCTGSCVCEECERRLTMSVTRGLVYLVAAVSMFSAYKIAKLHFHEECKSTLELDCPLDSIHSEIDGCVESRRTWRNNKGKKLDVDLSDPIIPIDEDPDIVKLDDIGEGVEETFMNKEARLAKNEYWCSGNCMPIPFMAERERVWAKEHGCEKKFREGYILIDGDLKFAEREFARNHMHLYCRGISQQEILKWDWSEELQRNVEDKFDIALCCGFLGYLREHGGNPSVKCQVYTDDMFANHVNPTPQEIDRQNFLDQDLDWDWDPDVLEDDE